ncbi:MAG: VCBS repeat-containing protein [Pyrinomonadaceae bacterium]
MKLVFAIFCLAALTLSFVVPLTNAQFVCQPAPAPVLLNGSITGVDPLQTGRVTRDGKPSTCGSTSATLEDPIPVHHDVHNLTNPFNESVCVRVEQDFSACNSHQIMSVAYSAFSPATPGANVIGDPGFSTLNKGSYSFRVGPNASFAIAVHEVTANEGCPNYNLKVTYLRHCRQAGFDQTNDGRADPTIYHVSGSSGWTILDSETDLPITRNFGTVGDLVTGGSDYTGDGQTDLSVFRPSNTTWYYGLDQAAPNTTFRATIFGVNGDRPVPGDYDGDGINDIALWRSSDGNFYFIRSSDNTFMAAHWGTNGDTPISGDFDGDTKTDFAVVRGTSGGLVWYLLKSNYSFNFDEASQWGLVGDKVVPADYDGDAITDLAVWRPSDGTFYVRRSSDQTLQGYHWGTNGDIPQPADFDGDKKADFAVYRASAGQWFILNSGTSTVRYLTLGGPSDIAMTAPYRIQ